MAARIRAARELGDLKENAAYHIAKEDQAHLETRIKGLKERLRKARSKPPGSGSSHEGQC
jgi:transcription elongation factor GreA